MSQDVEVLFQDVSNIITELAQQGMITENLSKLDDLALVLAEYQYFYSAKWELENEVIPLLEKGLSWWPEISTLFTNASRLIDLATYNTTMDTSGLEKEYGYAVKAWDKLDYGTAEYYLQKILEKEPEIKMQVYADSGDSGNQYTTIFRDDFNETESGLFPRFDRVEFSAKITVRDGYAFLNMSNAESKRASAAGLLPRINRQRFWKYVGMEIRLRCSSDNKLESEIGGGRRTWLFTEEWPPGNLLGFNCLSPEADHPGLCIESVVDNQLVFREPVIGIDIRDWHTYIILWQENNATFLVDGEVVGTTDKVPSAKMTSEVGIGNVVLHGDYGPQLKWEHIDVPFDEYIQIDYYRMFDIPEPTFLSILSILGPILLPALLRRGPRSR
jgi:hypothetical protein